MAAALATAYQLPPEDPGEPSRGSMPFLALTPSSDPWNQTVFATPMLVLYLFSTL